MLPSSKAAGRPRQQRAGRCPRPSRTESGATARSSASPIRVDAFEAERERARPPPATARRVPAAAGRSRPSAAAARATAGGRRTRSRSRRRASPAGRSRRQPRPRATAARPGGRAASRRPPPTAPTAASTTRRRARARAAGRPGTRRHRRSRSARRAPAAPPARSAPSRRSTDRRRLAHASSVVAGPATAVKPAGRSAGLAATRSAARRVGVVFGRRLLDHLLLAGREVVQYRVDHRDERHREDGAGDAFEHTTAGDRDRHHQRVQPRRSARPGSAAGSAPRPGCRG